MEPALLSVAQQLCEVLARPMGKEVIEVKLKAPFVAGKFAWDTAKPFDAQLRKLKGVSRYIASLRLLHPEQVHCQELLKLSTSGDTWLEIKHVRGGRRILVLCKTDKLYVFKIK